MTFPVRNFHTPFLALLILAVAILSGVYVKSSLDVATDHDRFTAELREMRSLDADVSLGVLTARFSASRSYDRLAADMGRLQTLASRIRIPGYLDGEVARKLESEVAEYRRIELAKLTMVERFKSKNAVFRNSLDYFPAAAERLARQAQLAQPNNVLTHQLNELLQGVLRQIQVADSASIAVISERIQQIQDGKSRRGTSVAEKDLDNLLLHARLLLEVKPEMDRLMADILDAPTVAANEDVFDSYDRDYTRRQASAERYRLALYILALMLMAYVAKMVLQLRSTSHKLRDSNRELALNLEEQRRIQQSLRLYAEVFRSSAEGVIITDLNNRIIAVNAAFSAITGYTEEECLGKTPAILRSGMQDGDFYQRMWATLVKEGQWAGEIWNRRRNGEIFAEWLSITTLKDDDGRVNHYVAVFTDISERKEIEARLQYLAEHDALTGLPNRMLVNDRLSQALAQARRDRGSHVAVMFVDLDRFKNINDTLGHDFGDQVLRIVAGRLRSLVREMDTVSRQGGDEFVVILPQLMHGEDAGQVARKMVASLADPFTLVGNELTVTSSIGISLYPDDGEDPQTLMRHADSAMYRAKSLGRNMFCYYQAEMNSASMESLVMESRLRHAVDREQLVVFYQAQKSVTSERIIGVEALVRWNSPDLGLVSPIRFIPLAEETGLIVPIGRWVLQTACAEMQAMRESGAPDVRLAVNLSARQFTQPDLVEMVAETLSSTGFPPRLLELELTESILMQNLEAGTVTLARLKELGVHLAVDDFGTGYSSLAYLQRFPLDRLKIDRSFVIGVAEKAEDETIARAIIVLAHALGLDVVAEGVEVSDQYHILEEMGCDLIQGYYISRPVPFPDFKKFLTG